jgi:hypothetical protein
MAREKQQVKISCPCGWTFGPTADLHAAWVEEWAHIKKCNKPTTRTAVNGNKESKIDTLF